MKDQVGTVGSDENAPDFGWADGFTNAYVCPTQ